LPERFGRRWEKARTGKISRKEGTLAKILAIDDERQFCELLADKIRQMNHEATCAFTMQEGLLKAAVGDYDVVYLDVNLPDGNGLAEINRIRSAPSAPEVIIMTGDGDPDGAELAIKSGAWDYMEKHASISRMTLPLIRALQYREKTLAGGKPPALQCEGVVGKSRRMQLVFSQMSQAASSDACVLIGGETGTGKEMAALTIHNNSSRASRNFVVVDCASLTETLVESVLFGHVRGAYTGAHSQQEGLIRQADGGTLFLDEIGELPVSIQKSFLRVLQERRFRPLGATQEIGSDFRLIAATNRNLDEMAQKGMFRTELLYRIRSFQIDLPSLREHIEDIEELTDFHLGKICRKYRIKKKEISPELIETFKSYPWPGNVRELAHTLERAVAAAGDESTVMPDHLPENMRIYAARTHLSRKEGDPLPEQAGKEPGGLPVWDAFRREAMEKAERQYLLHLFETSGRDLTKALAISRLSRSRFYEILKKHRLTFPS
jgi:two-component system NtrC family response regulator